MGHPKVHFGTNDDDSTEQCIYERVTSQFGAEHITNEAMRAAITKRMRREELLATVKKRKLQWYAHVTRASGLSKTILQGTAQGGRRRCRQRKK